MNNNDNRPAAIVLVILMLVLPGSLIAREKRGATIVVTFKDGHFAEGELITVKPDSLLLFAEKDETVAWPKSGASGSSGSLSPWSVVSVGLPPE